MPNGIREAVKDEKELIKKAKAGDGQSFETLILSCKGKAYNIAFRYMRNEEDALDAMQESFIKIFRHLDKFNEQSRFDTWVYRIVVNTCNDMLRKYKKDNYKDVVFKNNDYEDVAVEIADKTPGPAEVLEKKEESGRILNCLGQISAEHRKILILRDVRGFSYDEIAEILDCSMGTVKSKISRARQKLKETYFSDEQYLYE